MAIARGSACARPAVARDSLAMECDLFDGNSEPTDQPRDLVQIFGIVILDRLRQPNEAFVVAHRR